MMGLVLLAEVRGKMQLKWRTVLANSGGLLGRTLPLTTNTEAEGIWHKTKV